MKLLKIAYCIFFLSFLTNAQSLDSIKHVSNFEKITFKNYEKDTSKLKYLKALFAIDSMYTDSLAIQKALFIDDFIVKLNTKKFKKLNPKKKIKLVFKKIHNNFLEKYDPIADFDLIISSKTYNCVSASALYAYTFNKLDIPFQVKEIPSHVFIVAYPNTHNIYVETTIPGNDGFYVPSENDMKTAVNALIETKLLTKNEVNKIGYNKAYHNYFYEKEFIKKEELIGIQYYNKAIYSFNLENYEESYNYLLKAEKFYSSKKINFLKKSIIALLIEKTSFSNVKNLNYIVSFFNNFNYQKDYHDKDIRYLIYNIITSNENNLPFLENTLSKLNKIKNTEVTKISKLYIYKFLIEKNSRLNKSINIILKHGREALKLDPKDEEIQNMVSLSIMKKFRFSSPNKTVLKKINTYSTEFPFIKKSIYYKSFMTILYSYLTQEKMRYRKVTEALDYFNELKKIINSNEEDLNLNQKAIGTAYWSVGAYYYGKSKLKKAKEILEEGKKFAPEHHNLNKVLMYVIDDLH